MPFIYVRYLRLPYGIEAVVTPNNDYSFDVYINSALCPQRQAEALEHEIIHIKMDHLYNDDPVIVNEKEAG